MNRSIKMSDYPFRYQPLLNWLRSNGLDTNRLLNDQTVEVADGQITATALVKDGHGHLMIVEDQVVTETLTVPLISAPETHGL